jgi:arylsulfatase A-like enzyme/lysophospholipase L1-like esterase
MRPFLILATALVTLAASAAERPNILFIFSDDHALNAISAYGGPLKDVAPTPNLDRIAREGMLFTRSFCSNSICGPSRAAILTGKHSIRNGFVSNEGTTFDGSQQTLPKLLQKAGYQTAIIGKWHLVSDPTGFDHWEILPGQGNYYNPDFITKDGRKRREGYCTDLITDMSIEWLEKNRDPEKPFLLMSQHKAPHRNWAPAPRHLDLFDEVNIPEPATLFDDYANRSEALKKQSMSIAKDFYWGHDMKFHGENVLPDHFLTGMKNGEYERMSEEQKAAWDAAYQAENDALIAGVQSGEIAGDDITRWKYQRYIKDYLRTIRSVDENIGRLLEYLDKTGLAKNTIVIYSSDQGFYLGEHGWYDKRWMFEESLAMPLMVRWPGKVKEGITSAAMVQNIDYAPTLLEVAGAAVPEEMQGRSFLPVLAGGGAAPEGWRDAIYYYYSGEGTHTVAAHDGVRTERYKLMYFPATKEWNLFDLEVDPQEMKSFHDDPEYASTFSAMKARYEEIRRQYGVTPATTIDHRFGEKWWNDRHQEKKKQASAGGHELVFIGDSITQGWEAAGKEVWEKFYAPRKALNLGYSGDRTEHVLWRLFNGELPKADPKAFVVMIGTNNTGHRQDPAEETAAGVKQIIDQLRDRKPNAKILLLSVFPRDEKPDGKLRKLNDEINALIRGHADGDAVRFLDLAPTFLAEDGTLPAAIMPDFLHPVTAGYELWAEAMEPVLKEMGL